MVKRGQVSVEYLALFGFLLLIMSIVIVMGYYYAGVVQEEVTLSQTETLARELLSTAEEVYYMGSPARLPVKSYIPERVTNITTEGNILYMYVRQKNAGIQRIPFIANITMVGHINWAPGLRTIHVIAHDDHVSFNASIT